MILWFLAIAPVLWHQVATDEEPCPSLHSTINELNQVDDVIFQFASSAANITIRHDDVTGEYFYVTRENITHYVIRLSRVVNLNDLNPLWAPVLVTNEDVECQLNFTSSASQIVRAVDCKMVCVIERDGIAAELESDLTVAIRDVNNHPPEFACAPYYRTISELSPVSSTIFNLKGLAFDMDIDGGIGAYMLEPESTGHFAMSGSATEGLVIVNKTLDFDEGPTNFILNITVYDIGEPPRHTWTLLHIDLADGDDLSPVFEHHYYRIALPEHTAEIIGMEFPSSPPIRGWDADRSINAPVGFAMADGHVVKGQQFFALNPDTGKIIPLLVLDRSIKASFVVSIKVYQLDSPSTRFSYSLLVITIEDTNDHIPEMISPMLMNVTIPEGASEGYYVTSVTARDLDQDVNADFVYRILQSNQPFRIEQRLGHIYVAHDAVIDRELQDHYVLTVYAEEIRSYEEYKSANVTVFITIADVNDNAPVFKPGDHYTFKINESSVSLTEPTYLGRIEVGDRDIAANRIVTLDIYSGNIDEIFNIEPSSGELYITAAGQLQSLYGLVIIASDGGEPSLSSICQVSVQIFKDLPDIGFTKPVHVFIVPMGAPLGSEVGQLTLYGVPLGDVPVYTVNTSYFGTTENQCIVTQKDMDSHYYEFEVIAALGRQTTQAMVIVLVEEATHEAPVLPALPEVITVNASLAIGDVIYTINGSSSVVVTYTLSGGDDVFHISPTGGEIYARRPPAPGRYLCVIQACDQHLQCTQSNVSIYAIDVANRFPPVFDHFIYEAVIAEDLPLNTNIFNFQVSDPDPGPVTLYIASGNHGSVFKITKDKTLQLQETLDYERQSFYELVIVATDYGLPCLSSTTLVHIQVTDINDNPPVFLPAPKAIHLLSPVNAHTRIFKVLATDEDSSHQSNNLVKYVTNFTHQYLDIDEDTGEIFTKGEALPIGQHVFNIIAYNPGTVLIDYVTLMVVVLQEANQPVSQYVQHITNFNESHLAPFVFYRPELLDNTGVQFAIVQKSASMGDITINPESGLLNMLSPLDRESADSSGVVISAASVDDSSKVTYITISMLVLDTNDCEPFFPYSEYRALVHEGISIGSEVFKIGVMDDDLNTRLEYFFPDDMGGLLRLEHDEMNSVSVRVAKQIDFDDTEEDEITLMLYASDGIHTSQPATLKIKVLDVNDNWPEFNQTYFVTSIPEDFGPNSEIITITATDIDSLDAGMVRYDIEGSEKFLINSSTGVVMSSTNAVFDHELIDHYNLSIIAEDTVGHKSTVQLTIRIEDLNDNDPYFVGEPYIFYTLEGNASLSLQMVITVEDQDAGRNGTINLYMDGPHAGLFHLEVSTEERRCVGMIQLLMALDHEEPNLEMNPQGDEFYLLNMTAVDDGVPPRAVSTSVTIYVYDLDDNPPMFTTPLYTVAIDPLVSIGSAVLTLTASDADNSQNLTYLITAGNSDGYFDVATDGRVVLIKALEESFQFCNLTVAVTDGVHEDLAIVEIYLLQTQDIPVFTQDVYNFFVYESNGLYTGLSKVVGQVGVVNQSLDVMHHLEDSFDGLFSIDASSGVIMLIGSVDREVDAHFSLVVMAETGAAQFSCNVEVEILDLNDNAPVFLESHYYAIAEENSQPGTTYLQMMNGTILAIDADIGVNEKLTYSIYGNGSSLFEIDENTAVVKVVGGLNREEHERYDFTVVASDLSGAPGCLSATSILTVHIKDTNDMRPVFVDSNVEVAIPESLPVGSLVLKLTTVDADLVPNKINQFEMIAYHGNAVTVNRITGEVYTIGELDREVSDQYTLNVSVFDPNLDGIDFCIVTINITDVNDCKPKFVNNNWNFTVCENQAVNTTVDQVTATDGDIGVNGQVRYQIIDNVPFNVDPATGVIYTLESLNTEEQSSYLFNVEATDSGQTPLTSRTIVHVLIADVNEYAPQFALPSDEIDISEHTRVGSVVYLADAVDEDATANIKYYSNSTHKYLRIDEDTGLVFLYHEINGSDIEHLIIIASDEQFTRSMLLTVTVASFPVLFENATYVTSISEEVPLGSQVIRVFLKEDTRNKAYEFVILGTDKFAIIDTGQTAIIQNSGRLDYEESPSITFIIKATNNFGHSSFCAINIELIDINDNAPVFQAVPYNWDIIEGNYSAWHSIGFIQAADQDKVNQLGLSYLLDQPDLTMFRIEEFSGQVLIRGLFEWSPDVTFYEIAVMVTDGVFTSVTKVTINILDMNDHTPVFLPLPESLNVSNNISPGTEVLSLIAFDADSDHNGAVVVSMAESNPPTPFVVKSKGGNTGALLVAYNLRYTRTQDFNITLIGTDFGRPAMRAYANVAIHITQTFITPPKFISTYYEAEITISDTVGRVILVLEVTNITDCVFSIIDGDDHNVFSVDEQGALILSDELNATSRVFELLVIARSVHNPDLIDHAKVVIQVQEAHLVTVTIDENIQPPIRVLDLKTTDEHPQYLLLDNTDTFAVDATTGVLWCKGYLDRENIPSYDIHVQQSYSTGEEIVHIIVNVTDMNDNKPQFSSNTLVFGVPMEAYYGFLVGALEVSDMDIGYNSELVIELQGDNAANFYETNGLLFCRGGLLALNKRMIEFTVCATDQRGNGTAATAYANVYVLRDDEQAVLVASVAPDVLVKFKDEIIKGIADILSWDIYPLGIEIHSDDKTVNRLDFTMTDMYFYAVDKGSDTIVSREAILRRAEEESEQLEVLFSKYNIKNIAAAPQFESKPSMNHAGISLVVLACFIVLAALVAACVLLAAWKKEDPQDNEFDLYSTMKEDLDDILYRRSRDPYVMHMDESPIEAFTPGKLSEYLSKDPESLSVASEPQASMSSFQFHREETRSVSPRVGFHPSRVSTAPEDSAFHSSEAMSPIERTTDLDDFRNQSATPSSSSSDSSCQPEYPEDNPTNDYHLPGATLPTHSVIMSPADNLSFVGDNQKKLKTKRKGPGSGKIRPQLSVAQGVVSGAGQGVKEAGKKEGRLIKRPQQSKKVLPKLVHKKKRKL